jgi:hypothetical protein
MNGEWEISTGVAVRIVGIAGFGIESLGGFVGLCC